MIFHYLNLTNGIEIIPHFHDIDFRFIRIQSSHCEQKHWENVIMGLDYDFLLNVALGHTCVIYDFGSRSADGLSRAVWEGIPFIQTALLMRWFKKEPKQALLKNGVDVKDYFISVVNSFGKKTKRKLDYFLKFLNEQNTSVNIVGVSTKTNNDGNFSYYKGILDNARFMMDDRHKQTWEYLESLCIHEPSEKFLV